MAIAFHRPTTDRIATDAPEKLSEAYFPPASRVFDDLAMVEMTADRLVLAAAAKTAEVLFDAVEPGTEVQLATGTRYLFDPVFGIVFRDGAPLNVGRFGRGPAGPFDAVNLIGADRFDALAFLGELPTLLEELGAVDG